MNRWQGAAYVRRWPVLKMRSRRWDYTQRHGRQLSVLTCSATTTRLRCCPLVLAPLQHLQPHCPRLPSGFAHPLAAACDDGSVRLFGCEGGEPGLVAERVLAR